VTANQLDGQFRNLMLAQIRLFQAVQAKPLSQFVQPALAKPLQQSSVLVSADSPRGSRPATAQHGDRDKISDSVSDKADHAAS
jgi:hypothetical protein